MRFVPRGTIPRLGGLPKMFHVEQSACGGLAHRALNLQITLAPRWCANYHGLAMIFADLALSRRLEAAEASACALFAEARSRAVPSSGACSIHPAGTTAVFDGVDSPCTQTFGLGLFEELTTASLDLIEQFFLEREAPVVHEVSPFAGVGTLDLLCRRGYRPIELSSVLYQAVQCPPPAEEGPLRVRLAGPQEAGLWAQLSARGWAGEQPGLEEFLLNFGAVVAARTLSYCFLAAIDGKPGAAGVLSVHEGVALFGGAATVPEMRRRGLQNALLAERMRFASELGCDLAMMVTLPGSDSQRNGFHIAYTRTKWQMQAAYPAATG